MNEKYKEYEYNSTQAAWDDSYLWEPLKRISDTLAANKTNVRVFDLGCGNGITAAKLATLGFEVTGVDASESGIKMARSAFPECRFEVASAYDDLAMEFGQFPLVVSLEVVEHLFDPDAFARSLFGLVEPGGLAVVSTPYHGYLKNLALAVTGKMDTHFTALWAGGHIKFFSVKTLGSF